MSDTESKLLPLILVLGPPGAGKSTLCESVAKKVPLYHLSIGAFCRALRRGETMHGVKDFPTEAKKCLDDEIPIPGHVLVPMILDHLNAVSKPEEYDAIILDGFPRSRSQQQLFEQSMPAPVLVLSLECAESIRRKRYLGRNDALRPGEDPAQFERRTQKHFDRCAPIEQTYREKGILVTVNTTAEIESYVDDVASQIKSATSLEGLRQ